jgi:hypothetical protein
MRSKKAPKNGGIFLKIFPDPDLRNNEKHKTQKIITP